MKCNCIDCRNIDKEFIPMPRLFLSFNKFLVFFLLFKFCNLQINEYRENFTFEEVKYVNFGVKLLTVRCKAGNYAV